MQTKVSLYLKPTEKPNPERDRVKNIIKDFLKGKEGKDFIKKILQEIITEKNSNK